MKPIDGVTAIAVILIASFAIDRIVTGLLFVLSFTPLVSDPKDVPEPDRRQQAEKKYKLMYFVLSGALAIPLLSGFGGVRIFSIIGFPNIDPILDTVVTGLILVGGSDRVSAIIKATGASAGSGKSGGDGPIEITGRLVLEDSSKTIRAAGEEPE